MCNHLSDSVRPSVLMAQCPNDFKAFIFSELGDIRKEMAASVRATKLRRTYSDTESTNSGASSVLSNRSGASEDGTQLFATPLCEQPPEIRPLLERAVELTVEGTWSRGACQRYFAMLRMHYEPEMVQPTRVGSLSFCQLQELCGEMQLPPPPDYKSMPAARAAISKKCAGVIEYFVTRYLAEKTACSLAFLAGQSEVLGSGAVIQYVSRSVVTTAMVINPVAFYDQREGRCVASLSYRTISLDDESSGYARTIKKVLVSAPAPRVPPNLELWLPCGDRAREFVEGARHKKCFMKIDALRQLATEVGVPHEGLTRDQVINNLATWASQACQTHLETQLHCETFDAAVPNAE